MSNIDIKLSQGDVKSLLDQFYDENAHYEGQISLNNDQIYYAPPTYPQDLNYEIEPGYIKTISKIEINYQQGPVDVLNETKTWHEIKKLPLEKIKNLSMYNELVDKYDFIDEEYVEDGYPPLNGYLADHGEEDEHSIIVTIQNTYSLNEDHIKALENHEKIYLSILKIDIVDVVAKEVPPIIKELNLTDQLMQEENDALHHDVTSDPEYGIITVPQITIQSN